MHDPVAHHTGNILAVGAPLASILAHGPQILTVILTVAGIAWYCVLFYDRFIKRK